MRQWQTGRRGGFTLVELLVVLTILVILASLTIPAIVRLLPGSRDEISRTAQTVYSLLTAARQYAATYNVETAVVYSLNNYIEPAILPNNDAPLDNPVVDSIMGVPVRTITAAAVMYKLPTEDVARWRLLGGGVGGAEVFYPVPRSEGNFEAFPPESVILLQDPRTLDPDTGIFYGNQLPRYVKNSGAVGQLGMYEVGVWPNEDYLGGSEQFFPAHVFTPGGQIKTFDASKERFEINVARVPSAEPEQRLIEPNNPGSGLQVIPIELFRSTGRVKIAS